WARRFHLPSRASSTSASRAALLARTRSAAEAGRAKPRKPLVRHGQLTYWCSRWTATLRSREPNRSEQSSGSPCGNGTELLSSGPIAELFHLPSQVFEKLRQRLADVLRVALEYADSVAGRKFLGLLSPCLARHPGQREMLVAARWLDLQRGQIRQ